MLKSAFFIIKFYLFFKLIVNIIYKVFFFKLILFIIQNSNKMSIKANLLLFIYLLLFKTFLVNKL
jgi:hypothetical protein